MVTCPSMLASCAPSMCSSTSLLYGTSCGCYTLFMALDLQRHSMPLAGAFTLGVAATLALAGIVSIVRNPIQPTGERTCQEVIVAVNARGSVLARCPPDTYIDILDDNVVCRCGPRPDRVTSPPTELIPKAEPPAPRDDGRSYAL